MKKLKMNTGISLLIAIMAGAGAFFFVKCKNHSTSIPLALFKTDTLRLSGWEVRLPQSSEGYSIYKESGQWRMKLLNGSIVDPDTSYIRRAVQHLTNFVVDSVASTSKSDWEKLGVDEKKGKRLNIFENGSKKYELIIGNTDFHKSGQFAYPYVRKAGEETTYVLPLYLDGSAMASIDKVRKTSLVNLAPEEIQQIVSVAAPDKHFELVKGPGMYLIDGLEADNEKVMEYFKNISALKVTKFGSATHTGAEFSLYINGGHKATTTIKASRKNNDVWIIESTANHGNYLEVEPKAIAEIFRPREYFLKTAPATRH